MSILFEFDSKWEHYLHLGERRFIKEKAFIYRQGDIGDGFYYIQKGLVKVTTTTTVGNERLLNIAVPGQLLGIQAMDRMPHFTTAAAVSDSVLSFFSCETVEKLIVLDHELMNTYIQSVVHKMHILADTIYMDAMSPEQQLATILLNLYDDCKNYDVPLTQQDLSKCTGLTRITIYKILKQWKQDQVIEVQGKKFLLKNPEFLKSFLCR